MSKPDIRAEILDVMNSECATCGTDETEKCPNSLRACGHHCNHSWSHDECCWCGKKWGED